MRRLPAIKRSGPPAPLRARSRGSRAQAAAWRDTPLRRQLAALFSVWLILAQAFIGVPLAQRIMAPVEFLPGGGLSLCTAGGHIDVGGDHAPADQAPSCPFCMPLCAGAITLAVAPPVPVPSRFEPLLRGPLLSVPAIRVASPAVVRQRGPPIRVD